MSEKTVVRISIIKKFNKEAFAMLASMELTLPDAFRNKSIHVVSEKSLLFDTIVPDSTTIAAIQDAGEEQLESFDRIEEL